MEMHQMKRVVGPSPSQDKKEMLITFLEENKDVARNQFVAANGAQVLAKKWDTLADKLNGMGGANKNSEKWKKFWDDLKSRVKKKATEIKAQYYRSGVNGTMPLKGLNNAEKRIISIISDAAVDGDGASRECGRDWSSTTVSFQEISAIRQPISPQQSLHTTPQQSQPPLTTPTHKSQRPLATLSQQSEPTSPTPSQESQPNKRKAKEKAARPNKRRRIQNLKIDSFENKYLIIAQKQNDLIERLLENSDKDIKIKEELLLIKNIKRKK